MKIELRVIALIALLLSVTVGGCNKNDAVSHAEKQDAINGVPVPSISETKDIAEQGFIYGLPLVMNYAVMNEFAVDPNSGQFKAPFNQIKNEHHVATPEDTAVITPNSDTPYSMLWSDLRAEPLVVTVPAVQKPRYYSVQLIDGNTYNFGYIGSRATGFSPGSYLIVGPDWNGTTPPGIKKVFTSTTPFALVLIRTQLINPQDMPNVEKIQAGYKAQPLSAFLNQPAPPAAPKIDFLRLPQQGSKLIFSTISPLRSNLCLRRRRRMIFVQGLSALASDRVKNLSSKSSRLNTKPQSC